MRICFVLPANTNKATGGYKIVYEYANRLCNKGFDVSILYLNSFSLKRFYIPRIIKRVFFDFINCFEPRWFHLDKRIEKVSDFSNKRLIDLYKYSAVVVATSAATTAKYVRYNFLTNKKIYLIQGKENWSLTEGELNETYRLGMTNVVVSKWLKEIVDSVSKKESILLSNPIDNTIYIEKTPYFKRYKHSIGVLYNPNECKGFQFAIQAINKVKNIYPDLIVYAFGAFDRPKNLPNWIIYKKNAAQKETVDIYNSVRVYLCASIEEGFGLTGLESIACGCVLVTTDFQGAKEYAKDDENALVSPVCDVDALVKNICRVFEDDTLAIKLTNNGKKSASLANWDKAVNKLIELFNLK